MIQERHWDIERALVWAYRDQKVDFASGGMGSGRSGDGAYAIMEQGLLGRRIQTSGLAGMSGFDVAPDALTLDEVVSRFGRGAELVKRNARHGTQPSWTEGALRFVPRRWGGGIVEGVSESWRDLGVDAAVYSIVDILGSRARSEDLRWHYREWHRLLRAIEVSARQLAPAKRLRSIILRPLRAPAEPWMLSRPGRPRAYRGAMRARFVAARHSGASVADLMAEFRMTYSQAHNLIQRARQAGELASGKRTA